MYLECLEVLEQYKKFTDAQKCLIAGMLLISQNKKEEACILFEKAIERLQLGILECMDCKDIL